MAAHITELLAAEGLPAAFSGLSGIEPQPELEPGQIDRIRARLAQLNERWQATGPGEVVRLRWPGQRR